MRAAFLGPEGSFTHQAARALRPAGADLWPRSNLTEVLRELTEGRARYAVAALDSAAGPIRETRDLIDAGAARIVEEHRVPVSFDLYRRADDAAPLVGVLGHEKALAQIGPWIAAGGLAERVVASNTAGLEAVRDGSAPGWGAVGPPGLADQYQLAVTDRAVEAPARCETLFVLLERAGDTSSADSLTKEEG